MIFAPLIVFLLMFDCSQAEVRRFQDLTIKESVVWNVPAVERHLIVGRIAAVLLQRKLILC